MASAAKQVYSIEIIEEDVVAANENTKLNGLDNCEFISGFGVNEIVYISCTLRL